MTNTRINDISEAKTCILCGEHLHYVEDGVSERCDYCGKETNDYYECHNSHIICSDCVSMPVSEYIKSVCMNWEGNDPIELAVEIMNSPLVRMHGAEHHFIVPAVMLTCVHNHLNMPAGLRQQLEIAEKRAIEETPNFCDFKSGNCGAAVGTGVFLSMHLGRDRKDEDEWSMYNDIVSDSLRYIREHGGPRCCKRDTYLSIQAAIDFLRNRFAIELPYSEAKCTFSLRNRTCGREECNYYNISYSLV